MHRTILTPSSALFEVHRGRRTSSSTRSIAISKKSPDVPARSIVSSNSRVKSKARQAGEISGPKALSASDVQSIQLRLQSVIGVKDGEF